MLKISSPEAMEELGFRIAGMLRAGDVLCLTGELGSGKTTLSRGIGAGLNGRCVVHGSKSKKGTAGRRSLARSSARTAASCAAEGSADAANSGNKAWAGSGS